MDQANLLSPWRYRLAFLAMAVAVPVSIYFIARQKRRSVKFKKYGGEGYVGKEVHLKEHAPRSTRRYRDMYYQLHHLEHHPDILQPARDELLSLLAQGLAITLELPKSQSILSLGTYTKEALLGYLDRKQAEVQSEWVRYQDRRKQGEGPTMFPNETIAKEWLVHHAPHKFVDGAWLGHIHKINTPFRFRGITREVWQVLSEELGDGDLSKHHVTLYRQLLDSIGCPLPVAHTEEFVNMPEWDQVDNYGAWEDAVGQLVISLFPDEFLPEILGFNMHFEAVKLDTMQAAYELKALGINPYYFLIHISIDNADSGHTAMATHAVTKYLDLIRRIEGEEGVQKAWKRIQTGYIMSQTLGDGSPKLHKDTAAHPNPAILINPLSEQLIEIFKAKAAVSQKFHYQSKVRIGSYALSEWLNPSMWEGADGRQQIHLLNVLSQTKPWVAAGNSERSRILKELSWGGRMFGAFTESEVAIFRSWIDSLGPKSSDWLYWEFTGQKPIVSAEALLQRESLPFHPIIPSGDLSNTPFGHADTIDVDFLSEWKSFRERSFPVLSSEQLPYAIPLWFGHVALLEGFVNTPSQTSSPLYACVIRLLRAQAGFEMESDIVAGMDEFKRPYRTSLADIGLLLFATYDNWGSGANFMEILQFISKRQKSPVALQIAEPLLVVSAHHESNTGLLLGLAAAFMQLKDMVKPLYYIHDDMRSVLGQIMVRETSCIEECAGILKESDPEQYKLMGAGLKLGQEYLERYLSLSTG